MNYLSFQPAFDVFHTGFRFLRLRRLLTSDGAWHFDQVRIADFYLLFPFRLKDLRLKKGDLSIRKTAQDFAKTRYENQPDDHLLFARMKSIQWAAAGTLTANGFFDENAFKNEFIVETSKVESESLSRRIDRVNSDQAPLMQALRTLLEDYNLLGPDGLKARSSLLEYRYDAV